MRRWTLAVLFLAIATLTFLSIPAHAQGDILQQADAAWNEKSYARALELYRKALAGGAVPDSEEIEYRIAVSLGKTQKWDEALAAGKALLGKTEWKARVLYWLGRLATQMPHEGYKVGDKIYRGQDYPKIAGAEKPEQVYLGEEDAQATLAFFEQARIQAQIERRKAQVSRYSRTIHPLSNEEEIDLNFDLAAYLPTREQTKFIEALDKAWKDNRKTVVGNVDNSKPYDPKWNLPTKVLYLYNEIKTLDNSRDKHDTVLSLLAKGMFLRAYRQHMDSWAQWYDETKKTNITRPYPFDELQAIPVWREAVKNYPRDPIIDRILILIAQTYQQQGDSVKALAVYQELIAKYPKSKWVSDARANIQQITKREISLDTMGAQPPDKTAKINVNTRNLKTIKFTAYRVQLEKVLTQEGKLNSPNVHFTQWGENFGSIAQAQQFFGPKVAEWTLKTKDKGNYQGVYETIDTPLKELGAYAVIAESANVRSARLLLISDLAILKKTDRDEALAFVADARSGKPENGVNVVLKEVYYDSNQNNERHRVSVARGQSGEVGFFEKKLTRGANIHSQNVQAFAWIGNRYALTGSQHYGYYGYGDNRDEAKVYSYTDRPVYRPSQKIYFRQILTRRIVGGDQEPMKSVPVRVTINNPKGEEIYKQTLTSSEFGTINGEFVLPAGAPLGEYHVQAYVEQTNRNVAASGGSRFRVEEYKRPEFQVTVDAPDQAVKPGETVAAKINAKYYFGSPVPNATVKYTVRRSQWWANYHFPRPYEWLYSYWGDGDYDTGRRNIGSEGSGEIIKEGLVKTDAQGNAEVSFQTKPNVVENNDWWARYSNPLYTIEAEVTDASRRTIEGQGQVRVANQQYFAFLNAKRGYYLAGDRVQIELITQDANDKPQSASGKMVVYKLLPNDKEEKVYEEAIRTDEKGRATWTWPTDNAGHFRIAFEAVDDWNNKVVGSTTIWVAGPGLNNTQFRLQGITIVLDKQNYEEGDTAKVLLIADSPNSTVLLTQEAGGDILRRDVIFIEGKSKEITIPIEHKHAPNFAIAAALVKNFEVYQAQAEVFVPPTKQFLDISVKGDKSEYKPGEKGTFTITAKDWKGNPARSEVSVAMIDASLFYIQKDYAPDVRLFYYGERRANSVNLDSHRSGQPQTHNEDDVKYQQYEQHGWEFPDELGQLNLPPGQFGYHHYYRYNMRGARGEMAMDFAANTAAPMPAMAPMTSAGAAGPPGPARKMAAANEARGGALGLADGDANMQLATAQIRSNFSETAFWSPAVVTENGTAKVEVTFPDSVTQWHATARGLTPKVQVGSGEADVETKKNLLLRLQAPRFFVERDQVVLTANVHNYLKTDKRVKVSLDMGEGLGLAPGIAGQPINLVGTQMDAPSGFIEVKAGEETRVNWIVNVTRDGKADVQMTAQTDEDADAVKMNFPILVHGVQRFANQSGVLKEGQNQAVATINLPKERRFGQSNLNVQLNPSLAATMMDALPYLADYPYGCVEQTLSRFMPTVLVQKTLSDSGVNLQTLKARAEAYDKEAREAPIGERVRNSGYTYPTGQPNSRDLQQMASRLRWTKTRGSNPVYDQALVNRMTQEGLNRLYDMQREDGGWGWWHGSAFSDEYMSAYVMWGLAMARAAEVNVRDDVLQRGYAYLEKQMTDEDNLQLLTWMAHALATRGQMSDASQKIVSGRLFEQRERLTPYSQSLLAIALWNSNDRAKAGVLVRNLENTALVDEANGTARWRMQNAWWHWWNNDVETNAWALKAFLLIDPKNAMVDRSMKWLVTQSRGNHWRSTKETAMAVSALNDYVRINKELDVDYTLTVTLNDRIKRSYRVTRDNMLFFDNRFITGDLFLQDGANKVTIEKQGRGNLYWNASSEYFSLEEPIKASGNAIAVKRRYFKLTRNPEVKAEQSDVTTTTSPAPAVSSARIGIAPPFPRPIPEPSKPEFVRSEIKDESTLQSGDLIEVELTLDADNDYSYLIFEDMKAAGLEPVELRSGAAWGDGLCSNVELRDEKVALFVDHLPQGTRVLRYRMRAEIPGRFHALPTNGYAMYAPEVRAISDEQRIGVKD